MKFYGQRDVRWSNVNVGKTNRKLSSIGCTTCCICMGGSFFGDTINPGEACGRLLYTRDALILWSSIEKVFKNTKFHWRFYTYDVKVIDEALKNPIKVLLLNVDNGGHWVFAIKRIPFTNKFWVHDPWTNSKKIYGGVVGGAILIRK